ncbi:MAG: hypothetical protein Q4C91_13550 [Eubacteriales bacterium]|nr:hypothetical protein [Eubacteriales bacterium]
MDQSQCPLWFRNDKLENEELLRQLKMKSEVELSECERFSVMPVEDKEAVFRKLRETIPMPVEIVEGTKGTVNNHPAYESFLSDPYLHTGEDISGVLFTRYLKEGKRHTLFMNYSSLPDTVLVKVESGSFVPEVWNTFTGEIREADVVRKENGYDIIKLELPCNYGVVLVSDANKGVPRS